jgi:3-hydroxyacyl-[acyl-carrier-protein] dehydratase
MSTVVLPLPVAADHPAFAGHFPGTPILPGVVLLDEALQAIAGAIGDSPGMCQMNAVKFLSPVRPGQPLTVAFERLDNGAIRFDISSDERRVATGSLRFSVSGEATP